MGLFAVLALTDQPDGEEICADVFGDRAALVPYIMPGFALARKAQEVAAAHPDTEGLILLKHGIFSFGETAREAYERMIGLVSSAAVGDSSSSRIAPSADVFFNCLISWASDCPSMYCIA